MSMLSSVKAWVHHPGKRVMRGSERARATYYSLARAVKRRQVRASQRAMADFGGVELPFSIPDTAGYAVGDARVFPETQSLLGRANTLAQLGLQERGKKAQLSTYILPPEDLGPESAFMRFALDPTLLRAIARYFRVAPILTYVSLWESRYVDGPPDNSQLFHCDFEDQTQMKVFVFCSDVTQDDGPLTVISAAETARVRREIGYNFDKHSLYRLSDEQVASVVGPDRWKSLTGPHGTVSCVDTTRCLHFGSRVTRPESIRLVAAFQYVTPFMFQFPLFSHEPAPFASLSRAKEWTPLQQFALTGGVTA